MTNAAVFPVPDCDCAIMLVRWISEEGVAELFLGSLRACLKVHVSKGPCRMLLIASRNVSRMIFESKSSL